MYGDGVGGGSDADSGIFYRERVQGNAQGGGPRTPEASGN